MMGIHNDEQLEAAQLAWEEAEYERHMEWIEVNMLAVEEGRAQELLSCSTCPLDSQGKRPLRGIVKTFIQPQHFADPSVVFTLSCGHIEL